MNAIVMAESYLANTHFSIARYYGRIHVDGHDYVIVDRRGKSVFECSIEAAREGREKAIAPGEPADLCRADFVPIYRKLGREQFLKFLQDNPDITTPALAKKRLALWEKINTQK